MVAQRSFPGNLPDELVEDIFERLYGDAPGTIQEAGLVSKDFYRHAKPFLWREIQLHKRPLLPFLKVLARRPDISKLIRSVKLGHWTTARDVSDHRGGDVGMRPKSKDLQLEDVGFLLALAESEKLISAESLRYPEDEFSRAVRSGAEGPQVLLLLTKLSNLRSIEVEGFPGRVSEPLDWLRYLPKISHGFRELRCFRIHAENVFTYNHTNLGSFWNLDLLGYFFELPQIESVLARRGQHSSPLYRGIGEPHFVQWALPSTPWSWPATSSNISKLILHECSFTTTGSVDEIIMSCKALKSFGLIDHHVGAISRSAFDPKVLYSGHGHCLTHLLLDLQEGNRAVQDGLLRRFTSLQHLQLSATTIFFPAFVGMDDDDSDTSDNWRNTEISLADVLPTSLTSLHLTDLLKPKHWVRLSFFVHNDWSGGFPHLHAVTADIHLGRGSSQSYSDLPRLMKSFVGCVCEVHVTLERKQYRLHRRLILGKGDSVFTERDLDSICNEEGRVPIVRDTDSTT